LPPRTVTIDPFRGFHPLPTQQKFLTWVPPDPEVADLALLSSGFGGGKSAVGCRQSIRYTIGFRDSRHLVARFHYDDLEQTTMVTYFEALDRIGLNDGSKPGARHFVYRKSPRPEIDWWNGAKTLFRNLDDATGSKYGSFEINTAFIDEGSEVPSDVLTVLYPGRLRWHLPGVCDWKERLAELIAQGVNPEDAEIRCACPKRMWACTNPGDNGFLMDVVKGKLPNSAWFPVPPGENVYAGPGYHRQMAEVYKGYGPVKYARFILGSWDAFEGQRFPMLERDGDDSHFLPVDLHPSQDEYDIYEGHDFGWRNPHAVIWIAVHKKREYPPIVVDCMEKAETEIPQLAKLVLERRRSYGWLRDDDILAVGDPAGNQTRGQTGVTDIMLFAQHGVNIIPMTRAKDPGPRADLLALMFSRKVKTRDGWMRGLMFNPRAAAAFEAFLSYRFAEKNRTSMEDAPERFQKKGDHLVDAGGYDVAAIPDPLDRDGDEHRDWNDEVAKRRLPTPEELDRRELAAARAQAEPDLYEYEPGY
jgi:hypothetical protein